MAETTAYPYSDTVAGYVAEGRGLRDGYFTLATTDGREIEIELAGNASAEVLRNLDEPYVDATDHLAEMLQPGRYLFAYGVFYPDTGFEAKRVIFVGRQTSGFRFEEPDWWIGQLESIARFYSRAQFGAGPVDFRNYRTMLRLGGDKTASHVQETDTISRLVYGIATAYLLTGEDRFLDIAERGTEYLRENMRLPTTTRMSCSGSTASVSTAIRPAPAVRIGVRRRFRRHPDVRADLRAGRARPRRTG